MTAGQVIAAVSVLGGIIGGMGMGGGTLLIPLLTMAAGVEQHMAQAINLISFVPMSLTALFFHAKNGYVQTKGTAIIVAIAAVGAVAGSLLAGRAGGEILRKGYGAFLIALGAYRLAKQGIQAVKHIISAKKKKAEKINQH